MNRSQPGPVHFSFISESFAAAKLLSTENTTLECFILFKTHFFKGSLQVFFPGDEGVPDALPLLLTQLFPCQFGDHRLSSSALPKHEDRCKQCSKHPESGPDKNLLQSLVFLLNPFFDLLILHCHDYHPPWCFCPSNRVLLP